MSTICLWLWDLLLHLSYYLYLLLLFWHHHFQLTSFVKRSNYSSALNSLQLLQLSFSLAGYCWYNLDTSKRYSWSALDNKSLPSYRAWEPLCYEEAGWVQHTAKGGICTGSEVWIVCLICWTSSIALLVRDLSLRGPSHLKISYLTPLRSNCYREGRWQYCPSTYRSSRSGQPCLEILRLLQSW